MSTEDKARADGGLTDAGRDFIRDIVKADVDSGRDSSRVLSASVAPLRGAQ